MTRRSRLAIMALLAVLSWPGSVVAHQPTPGHASEQYPAYANLQYHWRSTAAPPGWMDHLIVAAGESVDGSRGSRAPTFAYTGSGSGEIGYRGYSPLGPCDFGDLACAAKFYDGTGDWRITFVPHNTQSDGYTVRWCENYSGTAPCWHVGRLAAHEFGHILDLGHYESILENTIMQSSIAAYSTTDDLKRCDRARLQLKYDVQTPYSSYADCFDHVDGGGDDGLLTRATIGASDTSVCDGATVIFDGILKVRDVSYGELGGNHLAGRTVYLQRAASSSGPFSTVGSDVTDQQGEWFRSYSYPGEASFWFRARYTGGSGLQDDYSNAVRVGWELC